MSGELKTVPDLPLLSSVQASGLMPFWYNGVLYHVTGDAVVGTVRPIGIVPNDPSAAVANTVAITAAIAAANAASVALTGSVEVLLPAGKIWIHSTSPILSNVTLRGAGMGKTTLYMPASSFTNTTWNTRNGTSLALDASGMLSSPFTPARNIKICDLTIESEVSDGRVLYGIRASNVVNLEIDRVEVLGMPVGNAIELNSILGSSSVHHCHVHDCGTAVTTYGAQPQMTGVEVDNNKVDGNPSRGIDIHDNSFIDIMFSGSALSTYGAQTDGINNGGIGLRIHDNYVRNVGEGIDLLEATDCNVTGNILVDCYHAGIKLIHGASRNNVGHNTILRPGRSGVSLSGVSAPSNDNYIHDNTIHDVNVSTVWDALSNAALHIISGGGIEANDNTFRDNKVTGGSNMDYAVRVEGGIGNRFYDTEAESWLVLYSSVSAGTAVITNAKKTQVRVGLGATEPTASGVEEIVPWDTEETDTQNEFDTASRTYTANSHRRLSVRAAVRCSPSAAGEQWVLRIKKNGTTRAEGFYFSAGNIEQFVVQDSFFVVPGDTVAVFVLQSVGARNIGGSALSSYLTIEEIAS